MIKTITEIAYLEDVALVTINNIPNTVAYVSRILNDGGYDLPNGSLQKQNQLILHHPGRAHG